MRDLSQELSDVLLIDASDAPQRLGSEESALSNDLSWGTEVDRALQDGLEKTIQELQRHRIEIESLPASGIPGKLQDELVEEFSRLAEWLNQEDFVKNADDLRSLLTSIETATRDAVIEMESALKNSIKQAEQDLQMLPGWPELTQEEQSQEFSQLEELTIEAKEDLTGLRILLNREYVISSRVGEIRQGIKQLARERRLERLEEEKRKSGKERITRVISVPATIKSKKEIDTLLRALQELQRELLIYPDMEITLQIEEDE